MPKSILIRLLISFGLYPPHFPYQATNYFLKNQGIQTRFLIYYLKFSQGSTARGSVEVHENILRSSKQSCPHKCEKLGPSECQEHNSLDQTEIKCVCQAMRVCMALRPKSKLPLMDWGNQDHHVLLALDGASLGV